MKRKPPARKSSIKCLGCNDTGNLLNGSSRKAQRIFETVYDDPRLGPIPCPRCRPDDADA